MKSLKDNCKDPKIKATQCQDAIKVILKGLLWVSLLHSFMVHAVHGNCAVDEKGFLFLL